MTNKELLESIWRVVKADIHNLQALYDFRDICEDTCNTDSKLATENAIMMANHCATLIPSLTDADEIHRVFALHKAALLISAPYDFESYLQVVEWERQPENRFYPRRKKMLAPVTEALQALADDKYDLLSISMPPGVGKTAMAIFFLTWLAGKEPDKPILGGSHSNSFVRGVYDECMRVMSKDGEYLWSEVFPNVAIVGTNAKDLRIDCHTPKRFETLEFTSIGAGNAGKVRAQTLLYCDDLVDGIEAAMSKERMEKLWETYTTDLRQRKIGKCKELHIATRWSVHDVIGRLESRYKDNPRAKFIVMPALNKNDESNFDYGGDVGFTTDFYHQQRDIMDDASWRALFMNEPIEREGLVYPEDELRRYFELPAEKPDAVISVCDTKDRGSDYMSMPIAYVYGQDYYIVDCICNNAMPDVTDGLLVDALIRHKVGMSRFESNSAGGRTAQKVQELIKEQGGTTRITTMYSVKNKETRIIVASGWVKEHCVFRDSSLYKKNSEYGRFMDFLCSYTMAGKNKHDDVPDSMAMLYDFVQSMTANTVQVLQRIW